MAMQTAIASAQVRREPPSATVSQSWQPAHDAGLMRARQLAGFAVASLIDEAELTPKPALVDCRGSGAHADLDLPLMRRSARSLLPGFVAMAGAAHASPSPRPTQWLRESLAKIGRGAEIAMLEVTRGSNAHRGAIWVLGLLVGSAALAGSRNPALVAALGADIARIEDRFAPHRPSNGERVLRQYGGRGARGQAEDGFPHVVGVALPALRAARRNAQSETTARLDALLAVMATLDDTCLLHRGGERALSVAQAGARDALSAGGSSTPDGHRRLLELDASLLSLNASPGGAADLLAAALFLDRLERADGGPVPPLHEWKA